MKNIVLNVGVILALVLGGIGVFMNGTTVIEKPIEVLVDRPAGANPGPEVFQHTTFWEGNTFGGYLATTTTIGTTRFTEANLSKVSYVKLTPQNGNATLTLPATSTMTGIVPKAGMCRNLLVENGTTTIGTTVTIAVGTGWDVHNATSTLAIQDAALAKLTYCRNSDADIEFLFDLGGK